jgi:phosphoadenosine phosphosulfate reductase
VPSAIETAKSALEKARSLSDSVLVAYSDGKDSRVVMDLATRYFKRVEGFYMWFVPDLEYINAGLAQAEKQWGVKIHQFPHWSSITAMKNGVYCNPWWGRDDVPDIALADIYSYAMIETGIPLILTGAKKADSGWRRRFLKNTSHWERIAYPLADWTKFDVLAYLRGRGIPLPDNSAGGTASGVALVPHELYWIYDNHPADFWKMAEYFPYIEALIWRRKFYGTEEQRAAGVSSNAPRATKAEDPPQQEGGKRVRRTRRPVKHGAADVQDGEDAPVAAEGRAVQSAHPDGGGKAKAAHRPKKARHGGAADVE